MPVISSVSAAVGAYMYVGIKSASTRVRERDGRDQRFISLDGHWVMSVPTMGTGRATVPIIWHSLPFVFLQDVTHNNAHSLDTQIALTRISCV
jgi:hypothetical protein